MRRLQIYLEEELDDALAVKARKEGTSKAALIRKYVAQHIEPLGGSDPLDSIVGDIDADPGPESIDDVVYGPSAPRARRHVAERTSGSKRR